MPGSRKRNPRFITALAYSVMPGTPAPHATHHTNTDTTHRQHTTQPHQEHTDTTHHQHTVNPTQPRRLLLLLLHLAAAADLQPRPGRVRGRHPALRLSVAPGAGAVVLLAVRLRQEPPGGGRLQEQPAEHPGGTAGGQRAGSGARVAAAGCVGGSGGEVQAVGQGSCLSQAARSYPMPASASACRARFRIHIHPQSPTTLSNLHLHPVHPCAHAPTPPPPSTHRASCPVPVNSRPPAWRPV